MKATEDIFCMDVDYRGNHAVAAGILFHDWNSETTELEKAVIIEDIAPYESGQFYKRELPCLVKLIDSLPALPSIFIIDGFVYLGKKSKPGLGAYLYEGYQEKVKVIGVAKTKFKSSSSAVEVTRGRSKKPLYVTSEGISDETAAEYIKSMHGESRIPTLLKKVDRLCRGSR